MRVFSPLLLAACAGAALGAPNGVVLRAPEGPAVQTRPDVHAEIGLDNGYDAGEWGEYEFCPPNSYVYEFELRYDYPGGVDDTAVNAVKMFCADEETGHDVTYITSAQAPNGDWMGLSGCHYGSMVGFRAKVLGHQGIFNDDVAVENVQGECEDGSTVGDDELNNHNLTRKYEEGTWSAWAKCPGTSRVCGMKTRVEAVSLTEDDTAVTDIFLYCCGYSNSTAVPPTTPPFTRPFSTTAAYPDTTTPYPDTTTPYPDTTDPETRPTYAPTTSDGPRPTRDY